MVGILKLLHNNEGGGMEGGEFVITHRAFTLFGKADPGKTVWWVKKYISLFVRHKYVHVYNIYIYIFCKFS